MFIRIFSKVILLIKVIIADYTIHTVILLKIGIWHDLCVNNYYSSIKNLFRKKVIKLWNHYRQVC